MLKTLDIVVLLATLCLIFLTACFYLLWRILKMAQISFTVNISISPAAQPLSAVSDPLNLTGQVGAPFSASLASNVQGGKPPYKLISSGTLPDGLVDDGSGNISGTPTTPGTSTLSVNVSDSGA